VRVIENHPWQALASEGLTKTFNAAIDVFTAAENQVYLDSSVTAAENQVYLDSSGRRECVECKADFDEWP
jgi:hypothetical protein